MANAIYNSFITDVFNGDIVPGSDTFKIMLVSSSYTPNVDTHAKRSDITNEVSGTGYTAGGATLSNVSVTQDNATDTTKIDADDVTWADSTITARGGVIYKSRGGLASADEVVCYFDFGSDQESSNGDFTIQFNTSGIIVAAKA